MCLYIWYQITMHINIIMHALPHKMLDHPRIAYFVKSLKINRAMYVLQRNITSLKILTGLVKQCVLERPAKVFKSIFLIAFFLRISNLALNSLSTLILQGI